MPACAGMTICRLKAGGVYGSPIRDSNRLLKKFQARARQGTNWRKSAVYTPVHEHFEPICNTVWCRMRVFQQPAKGKGFTDPLYRDSKFSQEATMAANKDTGYRQLTSRAATVL